MGSGKVGKTTLISCLLNGGSSKKYVAYRHRNFAVEFVESGLDDPDISRLDALIVVFDLTNSHSFQDCIQVLDNFTRPFVLVGNKTDSEHKRQVSSLMATRRAIQSKCVYTECSARYNERVDPCLFLLLDLIIDAKKVSCWKPWPPGPAGLRRLHIISWLVTMATMLQGIGMLMYGVYFIIHMDDKTTDWLGVSLIWSGILTFVVSFLGFYGTKAKIKEYLKVVKLTQYSVLSLLEAISKAVILVIYSVSSVAHPEMYHTINEGKGFRSMMCACLFLELLACVVTLMYRLAFTNLVHQASYTNLVYRF